jgi:hypothetical protein
VLTVVALPGVPDALDTFDLARFGSRALVARGSAGEHVAITDGPLQLRLDVIEGTVCDGPVLLEHRLLGISAINRQMPVLRQFESLCRTGRIPPWRGLVDPRLRRLIMALRVCDALADGASLRAIGSTLSLNGISPSWPGLGESSKSRVRRLVDLAGRLERLGPHGVLARLI